ncbi:hypothetical protein ASPZODRAFT_148867 [Penicilliopsis zonata CBS 506.65]|uniref:THUMP domain-containing protein n=1 Tax=Penicilliopsis zonata CBS 506.65 TaxID=1073090 RepID=A0A1L9SWZ0_9EURO|nr:hypothetical protein ASPZODRAFT_148867 [Penicilliopsis zonata CBS 506.65]OJJ51611.1 hypothetical protein ASPZODRAFT_148867 [Penicilliopsis zonata CBS 506.65]
MAAAGKRTMPGNPSNQSAKRRKGGDKWRKQQGNKATIESGDWGVFVTCDMGREQKCVAEVLDLFSQSVEDATGDVEGDDEFDADADDIEAQIKREMEELQPDSKKPKLFREIRLDIPCVTFIRFDKSIDPVKMVHDLCLDAHANPDRKRSRWVKRLNPVSSIRKTLSVDLSEFAKEILKPHFHSGGPPRKYAIRPSIRGKSKFDRDGVIKTVADAVGPEHPVDLKNYDLVILVDIIQNVIGMSVVGSDYDKLKRFNLAELYDPTPKLQAATVGKD